MLTLLFRPVSVYAEENQVAAEVAAPHALLMEVSTGTVLMEKAADEKVHPASVTKIMTMLLILEAVEEGRIGLDDVVTVSEHAASMGGSQVYLEPYEQQTVDTLLKCIAVASANDACVAMAEYVSGSEGDFVQQMNSRAEELGMSNTHFANSCGLDEDTHLTTARDVALMSRELLLNHPQIHEYCTIWMENITHVTKQGTKEFGLSNTNKLLKMANNFTVTGLKTGSTSAAKYCLSATAQKDGVRLIASIMAAPDYKARFADAQTLLNYGFSACRLYEDQEGLPLGPMKVTGGVEDQVDLAYEDTFSYLSLTGEDLSAVQRTLILEDSLPAPITPGQRAGILEYTLNGNVIGQVNVVTAGSVEEAGYMDYLKDLLGIVFQKAG